jgi:two-component system, OmpR family, sensor kinase
MPRRPIRRRVGSATRLAAFLAILLVGILSITTFETDRVFVDQSLAATTRTLAAEVDSFQKEISGPGTGTLEPTTVDYLRSRVLPQGEVIVVQVAPGVRLGSAGSAPLLRNPTIAALLAHPPTAGHSYRSTLGGVDTLYLVTPVRRGSTTVGTMVVASDLSQLRSDQDRVLALLVGEALVALVGAVAGAYLLLRRLLQNVGRITSTASSIEDGDLDRRLGDQGTDDEVGQLAATFDSMLDRLEEGMASQRQLLSDVSHQLRTPLTVIRGHLEILTRQSTIDQREVRDTVALVIDELDHMRALVERLLMLGRALEPDFLDIGPLDLRTFVAEFFESARVLADRRWQLGPVPDLVLDVDVAKLRGALFNLVDNAVKATTEGDRIEVGAWQDQATGNLEIAVDDSGPGIPPAQLETVLRRFGRSDSAEREGTGLGLAIARAVAEAHDGSLRLGSSRLGGCRACIALPRSRVRLGARPEPVGV